MKFISRAHAPSLHTLARSPLALVPLAAVLIAMVCVPIAQAASKPAAAQDEQGAAAPQVEEASYRPHIGGRISDRSSVRGDGVRVRGIVTHAGSGPAAVVLKARRAGHKSWFKITATKVKPGKRFTLKWRGGKVGRYELKLSVNKYGKSASTRLGGAYIFRSSFASYYGPGFYGGGLACGGRLTRGTVGVANKTLPCGTKVTFKVGSHIVTARVIDRGPFVAGREWDLTEALKNKLHFGSTGTVHVTR